jgi:hypothetical protein
MYLMKDEDKQKGGQPKRSLIQNPIEKLRFVAKERGLERSTQS